MLIIIIPRQCLWCCNHNRAIARVHPVHLMNVERRQAAANHCKTKPDDLGCESACTGCQSLHSPSPFIIITQPKSWYSFYRSTDGKGWVDLVSWLHTEMVYPSTDGHPGNTNRVWRSATTLIEANALPLSQTANQVNGRTAPTTFLVAPLL